MNHRGIGVGTLVFLFSAVASAQQVPAPPAGYSGASPEADVVLEPLLTAAEADLGASRAALALSRAAIVVSVVADGRARVRADSLTLLARQRLGGAPAPEVSAEEALTPLVDAAATDATAGRADLARARLDFVAARVVPTAPIAIRAQAIRSAMDAHGPVAPSPTVTQLAAPNPLYPTPGPAPAQPQAGYGYAAPTWTAPEPAPPEDPRRRSTGEIIELYVTAGVFGAYAGAWVPYGAGVFNTSSSSGTDEARALPLAMVLGAGTLVLGVFALDQIDGAMRTGQPAAMSIGLRFGLGIGALSLGIAGARSSGSTDVAFNVMGFSALGGLAIGAALGFGLEPHPSQVQFVQTVGLWGAMLGGELAATVAPQLASGRDAQEAGFGLTLGGLSAGIVAGLITSAAGANFSARRSWFMTLGALAGIGVGSGLWALISYTVNAFDGPAWGISALLGSVAGLITVGFLTGDDTGTRTWDEPQVSVAPMEGGAQLILSGEL